MCRRSGWKLIFFCHHLNQTHSSILAFFPHSLFCLQQHNELLTFCIVNKQIVEHRVAWSLLSQSEVNTNSFINPFAPRVSYGDIKEILTSEFVDEIPRCDQSIETSSAVLSRGTIFIYIFLHWKFEICLEF